MLGRSGAVAEVPTVGASAADIVEGDAFVDAGHGGRSEFGHGEAVVDVESEEGVVAVGGLVLAAPSIGGCGESLSAGAGGADGLVEGGVPVETRGATVDVVATAAGSGPMLFAEEGGIVERVGVGIEADDVEVLPVGIALDSVDGGFHVLGTKVGGVPTHGVTHEVAPPTRGVDTSADVGGKGCGRKVDAAGCTENCAPYARGEVGLQTDKEHAGIGNAVSGIVDHGAAGRTGLPEEEYLVVTADTDKI